MFTRILKCTLKPEKKEEFVQAAQKLTSAYKGQVGFLDLLTLISDEHPDQAFVIAVWKTRGDAEKFYLSSAPLLDLTPFVHSHEIEHYHLGTSTVFNKIAAGKAA